MKRVCLVLAIICMLLAASPAALAAGPSRPYLRPIDGSQVRPTGHVSLEQRSPLRHLGGRLLQPNLRWLKRSDSSVAAPARQTSASALRVPANVWAPAAIDSQFDLAINAAWADTNSYFGGAGPGFHVHTYASMGMTGGYYQRATWTPAGESGVLFRYQGSAYTSTDAARQAYTDGVQYAQGRGYDTNNCTGGSPNFLCASIDYVTNDGTNVWYDAIQINQCVIETVANFTSASSSAQAQINKILDNVDNYGLNLPVCNGGTPAQSPPPSQTPPTQSPPPSSSASGPLSVPSSAWAPATIDSGWDLDVDAAWVDKNSYFGNGGGTTTSFHGNTYAALGMQRGHYERASWTPSGFSDKVTFRYQTSVFGSAGAAANAWTDGVTHTQTATGVSSQNCANAGFQCAEILYSLSNGTGREYDAIQINNCLIETTADFTVAEWNGSAGNQIAQIQTNVDNDALNLPACNGGAPSSQPSQPSQPSKPTGPTLLPPPSSSSSAPGQSQQSPSFNLNQVMVRVNGKTVSSVKANQKAYFMAVVDNDPSNAPATFSFTVKRGSSTVFRETHTGSLSSGQGGFYGQSQGAFKTKKTGTYIVTASVTINGASKQATATFKVHK